MQMTSMGEVTLRTIQIFEVGGGFGNADLPISEWVQKVFKIAAETFNIEPNGNRLRKAVELRRMITYLTCKKFNGLGINNGYISLDRIGYYIAFAECRIKPYDHATIINANKLHIMALANENKGYADYVSMYKHFEAILINRGFITNEIINGKNKYSYTRS